MQRVVGRSASRMGWLELQPRLTDRTSSICASHQLAGSRPIPLLGIRRCLDRQLAVGTVPSAGACIPSGVCGLPAARAGLHTRARGRCRASGGEGATSEADKLWLIVGLGNPGDNYANTRHNIGFRVLDILAEKAGVDIRKLEKGAAVGRGELGGVRVLLAKPITFMNNSGEAVGQLARYYKVPASRLLVVSDDLDLPLGAVRLRAKGGAGGHNGLRSIIQHMGGKQDFPRLKLGIGRPTGSHPVADWVLRPFSPAERHDMEDAVSQAAQLVLGVLANGLDKALSKQQPQAQPKQQPQAEGKQQLMGSQRSEGKQQPVVVQRPRSRLQPVDVK